MAGCHIRPVWEEEMSFCIKQKDVVAETRLDTWLVLSNSYPNLNHFQRRLLWCFINVNAVSNKHNWSFKDNWVSETILYWCIGYWNIVGFQIKMWNMEGTKAKHLNRTKWCVKHVSSIGTASTCLLGNGITGFWRDGCWLKQQADLDGLTIITENGTRMIKMMI